MNFSSAPIRMALASIASILALSACSIVGTPGPTRTESRTVNGFSKVELAGSGELIIDQTGSETLTIEAGEKVLPELTSDVVGDTLVLGVRRGTFTAPGGKISYHLTVKDLTGLSVSGSGNVTAPKITTDSLGVDISGSGTVTVGGTARESQLSISGSGTYVAGDLASKTLRADISGSGDATVNVSDTLDVAISGSGSLTYSGEPAVRSDISGSGRVAKS